MPSLLAFVAAGTLIGLLGRHVARGDGNDVPAGIPILYGVGGLLLGWWVYAVVGDGGTDAARVVFAALVAVILAVVSSVVQRRRSTVYHYVGRPEDLTGPST